MDCRASEKRRPSRFEALATKRRERLPKQCPFFHLLGGDLDSRIGAVWKQPRQDRGRANPCASELRSVLDVGAHLLDLRR